MAMGQAARLPFQKIQPKESPVNIRKQNGYDTGWEVGQIVIVSWPTSVDGWWC